MLLSVLVALRRVTNHNTDDSQEDEEIEDENGSNGSEEGSVEHNPVAYKTAIEKRIVIINGEILRDSNHLTYNSS